MPISNIKIPRYNEEGEVSGFGITEDLAKPAPNEEMKTTFFTVVKETDCPIENFGAQENSNFCGRDLFFNTRLCRGDVGNAFVVLQRGIPTLVSAIGAIILFRFVQINYKILFYQAGITSQVSDRCLSGSGHDASSFVRVQSYLGWIKALTGMGME